MLRSSFRNVLLITKYIIGYLLCAIFYSYKLISTHLSIAYLLVRKTRSTTFYRCNAKHLSLSFFPFFSVWQLPSRSIFVSFPLTLILILIHTHTLRAPTINKYTLHNSLGVKVCAIHKRAIIN